MFFLLYRQNDIDKILYNDVNATRAVIGRCPMIY